MVQSTAINKQTSHIWKIINLFYSIYMEYVVWIKSEKQKKKKNQPLNWYVYAYIAQWLTYILFWYGIARRHSRSKFQFTFNNNKIIVIIIILGRMIHALMYWYIILCVHWWYPHKKGYILNPQNEYWKVYFRCFKPKYFFAELTMWYLLIQQNRFLWCIEKHTKEAS